MHRELARAVALLDPNPPKPRGRGLQREKQRRRERKAGRFTDGFADGFREGWNACLRHIRSQRTTPNKEK